MAEDAEDKWHTELAPGWGLGLGRGVLTSLGRAGQSPERRITPAGYFKPLSVTLLSELAETA